MRNAFSYNYYKVQLADRGIAELIKWTPGCKCEVIVLGKLSTIPDDAGLDQIKVNTSFVTFAMTSSTNPSVELYRHVATIERDVLSISSSDIEPEVKPQAEEQPRVGPSGARQLPGFLDHGAGLLATFNGPPVNRLVAGWFARDSRFVGTYRRS